MPPSTISHMHIVLARDPSAFSRMTAHSPSFPTVTSGRKALLSVTTTSPEMAATSQTPDKTYLPFRGVLNDPSLYSALDPSSRQIRCVDLHPGSSTDLVVCSLVYTTLDPEAGDLPSYEALSYCWGSVNDTVAIHLRSPNMDTGWLHRHQDGPDGAEANPSVGNFQVTRNLEAALRAHRRPNQMRRLWVDAICINQMSDKEKTHQVGQMNLIYKSAKDVLVWLGEADIWSKFIFRCQHLLEAEYRAVLERPRLAPKPPTTGFSHDRQRIEYSSWCSILDDEAAVQMSVILATRELKKDLKNKMLQPPFNQANMKNIFSGCQQPYNDQMLQPPFNQADIKHIFWRYLDQFLERTWFHRIWVFQEILMAQLDSNNNPQVTIAAGDSTMRWSHLLQLFKAADASRVQFPGENIRRFNFAWFGPTSSVDNRDQSLREYSNCTRKLLASDPRDKIFALLHVAKDTRDRIHTDAGLSPDYEKSTLDIALDYSGAGVQLPAIITTAEPIATETTYGTNTFDFDVWFLTFFDPLPAYGYRHGYPFRAAVIACVKDRTGSPADSDQAPTGHNTFFVTTDERLFSSNRMVGPGSLVVSSSGRPAAFVICPSPTDRSGDNLMWTLLGICSPHPPPLSS
jgi:hypothetical protein